MLPGSHLPTPYSESNCSKIEPSRNKNKGIEEVEDMPAESKSSKLFKLSVKEQIHNKSNHVAQHSKKVEDSTKHCEKKV